MAVNQPTFRDRARAGAEPVARAFGRLGLTPNALTLIGFGIAVVAAWQASIGAWLAAGLLVAFGAAFDLLDGALARATGQVSRLGAFMDSVFDRAGEAVVYIGIAAGLLTVATPGGVMHALGTIVPAGSGALVAVAALAAAFMVSYTRAKSESLGFTLGTGMATIGFAPREVRTVILAVGLIIGGMAQLSTHVDYPAGVIQGPPPGWALVVGSLGLITILATITTVQRIVYVYLQSKKEQ